jgi:hypothetical protein
MGNLLEEYPSVETLGYDQLALRAKPYRKPNHLPVSPRCFQGAESFPEGC